MKNLIKLIIFSFLLSTFSIYSQKSEEKLLTIIVKDRNNNPVPGAIILLDNKRQKRWTNSKGIYKVKFNQTPKVISAFSPKIGIEKIKYKGEKKLIVKIKEKNDSYVNVSNNKNKGINPIQYRDIYDYIRGQVPGLNIAGNNNITIRGYNSVNGSTTPLFILNDNQVDQDIFGNVVPTTIKSIEVLKGPECATYGARGANGVIIVKTL